jgi:hypothetical protein
MQGGTWYRPGSHNVIDDRTGFKLKASQVRREWTGNVVRRQSWEERPHQDLIRSTPDHQAVDDPRSGAPDVFLGVNDVTPDDLSPVPSGGRDMSIWDGGLSNWDGGASIWAE